MLAKVFFGWAYYRGHTCIWKFTGLIIGSKFVLAISQCTVDNTGVFTRNL